MADEAAEGGAGGAGGASAGERHRARLKRDRGPCDALRTKSLSCSMMFPNSRETRCKDHFAAYKECLRTGGAPPPEGK